MATFGDKCWQNEEEMLVRQFFFFFSKHQWLNSFCLHWLNLGFSSCFITTNILKVEKGRKSNIIPISLFFFCVEHRKKTNETHFFSLTLILLRYFSPSTASPVLSINLIQYLLSLSILSDSLTTLSLSSYSFSYTLFIIPSPFFLLLAFQHKSTKLQSLRPAL